MQISSLESDKNFERVNKLLMKEKNVKAVRLLMIGDTQITVLLFQELMVGCTYILVAFLIYDHLERKARSGSTIDAY